MSSSAAAVPSKPEPRARSAAASSRARKSSSEDTNDLFRAYATPAEGSRFGSHGMVSAQTWAEIRLWGGSGALAAGLFRRATCLGDNANERRGSANDGERGERGEDTEAGDREGDGAKKAGERSEHDTPVPCVLSSRQSRR